MAWTDSTLKTNRLTLRAPIERDKPAIRSLMLSPEVRKFLGGPLGEEQTAPLEHTTVGDQWGVFAIAHNTDGVAIGTCSFEREHGELEISFQLLPSHWSRGLGKEAVAAAIDWAWDNTDARSIVAVTQEANHASVELLRDLDFHEEATFEEFGATQVRFRIVRRG